MMNTNVGRMKKTNTYKENMQEQTAGKKVKKMACCMSTLLLFLE
jgi:hypothetical protein